MNPLPTSVSLLDRLEVAGPDTSDWCQLQGSLSTGLLYHAFGVRRWRWYEPRGVSPRTLG
jgi:hypothetical protein